MSNKITDPASLRAEAEARVARKPMTLVQPQPGENLLHELLHELRVHQIELEMQNDELRRAQVVIEESRDRYVDLYEFAPVGYLTLTREGMIAEANLTGASLLGVDRKKLINRRFAGFVTVESRDYWDRHFLGVLQTDERQSCELKLQHGDGSRFDAQVDCLRLKDGEVSSVRIALTGITKNKIGISSPSQVP
jgi:PAS domain S-box-containing protein